MSRQRLLIVTAAKYFVFAMAMFPIMGAAIATGMLFGSYNLAIARNPEEVENIFNTTLMGFALIETFVFIAFILAGVVFVI